MPELTRFRSAFDETTWARFMGAGDRVLVGDGEVVLHRGDPPSCLFWVLEGTLEAIDPRSNPPTVLGVFSAGTLLGEMSFLDGSPVSADVRGREPSVCLRIDNDRLNELFASDSQVSAAFHRGVALLLGGRTRSLTSSAVRGSIGQRESIPTVEITLEATSSGPARRAQSWIARGFDPHLASAVADAKSPMRRVPVSGDRLTVGSGEDCDVVLPDVRIAPLHAELIHEGSTWRVVSVGRRAVVVDGMAVASAPVPDGEVIGVGRYTLRLLASEIEVQAPPHTFALHARELGREVAGRSILDRVSFSVLGGELIALIGPSGAGKTTLLDALRGGMDRGTVHMDAEDFVRVLEVSPDTFGEVPQDDLVQPELTVEESLRSAARLRLPDHDDAGRLAVTNQVLNELGIERIRHSRIGDPQRRGISGGQRKRVNVAQELLTDETRVLLLDEPTSGLDPRSAADIARLARRLANRGKVVLMVTHDLSEAVLDQVDHLLVLAPGGRLAWFGPVNEAAAHFQAPHPAGIFDRLPDRTPDGWSEHYLQSAAHGMWVTQRQSVEPRHLGSPPPPPPTRHPSLLAQLVELTRRQATIKSRDRASLVVLLAQPLLVAAVMLLVFPQPTSGLIFLLVLSCFWFGMSASVRELIADQVLWRREKRLGISSVAWVGSKAVVLGAAVAVQCLGLTAVAWMGAGLDTVGFTEAGLLATSVLVGEVGMAVGLLVSSVWRRSEAAVGTIVLLLVPQIAFSGILMPLDQTSLLAQVLSWLTPVRYGYHLALVQGEALKYLKLGEWYERPVSGELFLMGLRASGEGSVGLSAPILATVLLGSCGLALGLAMLRLRLRPDR